MDTLRSYIRTVWHWDFQLAVGFGLFAALAGLNSSVRDQGVTVLIAETAIGAAFLAVVLTAIAIFVTFFDKAYRTVLVQAHDGNLAEALHPYILVAFVSAIASLSALIAAISWPALGVAASASLLAVSTFLTSWAVLGSASLVKLTAWHGVQRAKLMSAIEQASEVRGRSAKIRPRARS